MAAIVKCTSRPVYFNKTPMSHVPREIWEMIAHFIPEDARLSSVISFGLVCNDLAHMIFKNPFRVVVYGTPFMFNFPSAHLCGKVALIKTGQLQPFYPYTTLKIDDITFGPYTSVQEITRTSSESCFYIFG